MRRESLMSRALLAGLLTSIVLTPAQAATATPDFSGIWGHLTLPPFEPPLAGPGPVKNTARVNAAVAPSNQTVLRTTRSVSDISKLVGDYTNPILKPEAAEIVRQHGLISVTGVPYPTPSNQCWPNGVPYVFWNIGMQMLQQPNEVTILYSNDHEVRRIRMNAQHPAKVMPSWYGDSVGHYEGDTLVIDTVGFKKGPFSMIDVYGTPFSDALHVVERYRLIDEEAARQADERPDKDGYDFAVSDPGLARDATYRGKALQLEFRIEDGGVFTMPWSATIIYRRPTVPLGEWPEYVCADNPHGYFPGKHAAIPEADKPDF